MREDYGLLVNPDIKLQRSYFKEMTKLLGVVTKYKYPINGKDYNLQGELTVNKYSEEQSVPCIFEEHIQQKTAKLLGWNAEQETNAAIIHVPYDLEKLQVGCLFTIPSAFDNTPGRVFRVTKLYATMIYPASITCELVPEYETWMAREDIESFVNTDFNVLYEGD